MNSEALGDGEWIGTSGTCQLGGGGMGMPVYPFADEPEPEPEPESSLETRSTLLAS